MTIFSRTGISFPISLPSRMGNGLTWVNLSSDETKPATKDLGKQLSKAGGTEIRRP